LILPEAEQVLVAGDDGMRLRRQGASQNDVVIMIAADARKLGWQ
jgi:hypothetical protein